MQVINKHLSHEDDIDVGKDEQIVEIERKLSMRMRMLIKLKRLIWGVSAMRMVMRNGVTWNSHNLIHCIEEESFNELPVICIQVFEIKV